MRSGFYGTMPSCSYTTHRLLNWNVTPYFDKDIDVQRLKLRALIPTFVPAERQQALN